MRIRYILEHGGMPFDGVESVLRAVASGETSVASALDSLKRTLIDGGPEAHLDHLRHARTGLPEVVFAQNKTEAQAIEILKELYDQHGHALATRCAPSVVQAFDHTHDVRHNEVARALSLGRHKSTGHRVGIVCAGTSDLPVFEEAAFTLEWLGHDVERFVDAGVAGIHRIIGHVPRLRSCEAIAVVAGMEGALPGVVAGLVSAPIVAVPTSIGYGVSLGGFAALATMLATCSPGIGVVNIDNGFGAAALLHRIVSIQSARHDVDA